MPFIHAYIRWFRWSDIYGYIKYMIGLDYAIYPYAYIRWFRWSEIYGYIKYMIGLDYAIYPCIYQMV